MELILGTAEFSPNGYAGARCPSQKEIVRILNLAWEGGIRKLDCAEAYECEDVLCKYDGGFERILKSRRGLPNHWYHYKQDEEAIPTDKASVYTVAQARSANHIIVPLNINNTEFSNITPYCGIRYIRSVFDRGRLLKQGYTVKDCLSFVKRHSCNGVIVGVKTEKELASILKVW